MRQHALCNADGGEHLYTLRLPAACAVEAPADSQGGQWPHSGGCALGADRKTHLRAWYTTP